MAGFVFTWQHASTDPYITHGVYSGLECAGSPSRLDTENTARELHDVVKQALGLLRSSFGAESIKLGATSMHALVSAQERVTLLTSLA